MQVSISVPASVSKERRAILEQLHQLELAEEKREGKGLFDKVKEIFS